MRFGPLSPGSPARHCTAACLPHHGVGRLPEVDGGKPLRKKFKDYPVGDFHVDLAQGLTAEGRLNLFVAIDRTSKFAFARLVTRTNTRTARDFLPDLIRAVPCTTHTVLTDDGIRFASHPKNRGGIIATALGHSFDRVCRLRGIEHRLTKPAHPWANGRVERTPRTLKEATVRRYHYDSHDHLRRHLDTFLAAYSFAKRLKTLRGLPPHEFIRKTWLEDPVRFRSNPNQHSLGLFAYGEGRRPMALNRRAPRITGRRSLPDASSSFSRPPSPQPSSMNK